MVKKRIVWLAIMSALALTLRSAHAQSGFTTGSYQIISGSYAECCGLAGTSVYSLPDARQAFVELTVDSSQQTAQMIFLGPDRHTVLHALFSPAGSGFSYTFSNGIVFPDRIQFWGPVPGPMTDQASFSYTVSNFTNELRINGVVRTSCPGCADVPTEFEHTNVVVRLMPTVTIGVSDVGEVNVCWNSPSNSTYQLQYQSVWTSNAWTNLGSPLAGNGSTNCVTDTVLLAAPQRFYRVLTVP